MATAQPFTRTLARSLAVLAGCAALVSLAFSTARAAEPKAAPEAKKETKKEGKKTVLDLAGTPAPKVAPEAKKVVDAFGKYYAGLKGFKVDVTIALLVEQEGKKQTQNFEQKFSAERPNKFSYTLASAPGGATAMSDGKDMSLFIKGYDKYAVEKAPATLAGIFENQLVQGIVGLGNASNVIVAMLSDEPTKKLLEKVETLEYGGIEEVEGAKCHLLKATGPEMDWELWIDAGKEPLVRQFVPNLEKAFEKLAKANNQKSPFANMKITNTVSYKEWKVNPKFEPDAFVFNVPDGAAKVDTFMEIITSGMKQPEPEPHALLGKPAPPIELETLDGGKFDLAGEKGKVVILDFWATWCGPCVQAMPIIDKVAEKFKDKGVLLYAVNLEEKAEDIKAFLEENKLEVPIALDSDGAVAKAYLAVAIPQTVLIGKDGSVQVVKVGLLPDLEGALTKDLEALVAGKDLAADTLAEFKKKSEAKKSEAAEEAPSEKDAKQDGAKQDGAKKDAKAGGEKKAAAKP